ncbi:MAG: hypothetical protein EOO77_23485 [Oxalobacteraceae bacterium]|nr:MAG: hypothetical protein EOO77_23485 [Oxalobacteraceae bacterium]
MVLEGIADAGNEMSYSNYHNRLFRIAERVIRAYCAEHAIDLGPTQKEREVASRSSLERSLAEIIGLSDKPD